MYLLERMVIVQKLQGTSKILIFYKFYFSALNYDEDENRRNVWANHIIYEESEDSLGVGRLYGKPENIALNTLRYLANDIIPDTAPEPGSFAPDKNEAIEEWNQRTYNRDIESNI